MYLVEIIRNYLEKNDYNGLINKDLGCGCFLEDCMYCCEPQPNCQAYYHERKGIKKQKD